MTTIVYIDHDVSDDALARVEAFLENERNYNPNHNGAEFTIERDEYTYIDEDTLENQILINGIYRAIDGHDDKEI